MVKEDRGEFLITIFTPTYNREKFLNRLFLSLKNQTSKNFQWVVVDDGSTDLTEDLVKTFIKESDFQIIYKKVENSGKMVAINKGVQLCSGEYFFIVDSDDYISYDAVELIEKYAQELPSNYGGLVFRKHNISGSNFPEFPENIIDSTPLEIFYKKRILGDKAEVFKTSVLKEFKFPKIDGEKFIPEGLIWNRIGNKYKMRYINKVIYNFEYIDGGYTKGFTDIIKKNPKGFILYYKEMLGYEIPLVNKLKFFIRYIQCIYYSLIKNR